MALIIISIVISGMDLILGLLLLLAVGPKPGIFIIIAIGSLILAGGISKLVKRKSGQKEAYVHSKPQANAEIKNAEIKEDSPVNEAAGRYCPYCDAEFDDNNDEVCPNCGGRTKKGKPQL